MASSQRVHPRLPGAFRLARDAHRARLGHGRPADHAGHHLAQVAGEYDYILIDTPPSRDVMVTNALMASDFVLIPCVCDDYSRDSVYRTVAMCQQLEHDEGEKIDVLGIILTMVEKTALTEVIRNELRESQLGSKLFAAEIRKSRA